MKKSKLTTQERAKQKLRAAFLRRKGAKAKASPENSAEIEAPWKDKFEQKNWRVTREFEGGQKEYGHEGLCVRAEQADGNSYRLTLMSSDEKGRNFMESVPAEHCDEVDKRMRKPAQLFSFKNVSFDKKLRILGRTGITDVMRSVPFEAVPASGFKPEGSHIQLWLTLLEQAFPKIIAYNIQLLEILLSEDEESEQVRKTLEAEVKESLRKRHGRHLFAIHGPQTPEHPDGHWTLLSLERKDDESPLKVRYFETLDKANEVCLKRANKLLHCCGVEASAERCNTFRQSGGDCVWWVLHYAEVEARLEHGEGLGVA